MNTIIRIGTLFLNITQYVVYRQVVLAKEALQNTSCKEVGVQNTGSIEKRKYRNTGTIEVQ